MKKLLGTPCINMIVFVFCISIGFAIGGLLGSANIALGILNGICVILYYVVGGKK